MVCLSPVDVLPGDEEESSDHDAGACLVCGLVVKPHCGHALGSRSENLAARENIKGSR